MACAMIDYEAVKKWTFDEVRYQYTERDTILYALAVGFGADPLSAGELRYTFEKNLRSVPTMAAIVGAPGTWWADPRIGADIGGIVHGEQRMRWLRSLPTSGTLVARNRVQSLTDKGVGKGAIGVVARDVLDASSGQIIAQGVNVSVLRRDGGFSRDSGICDPPLTGLPPAPGRAPDLEVELPSLPQSALIYRLTGDRNPLHADPRVATQAGFQRPILHGLCTYGMACHAVLRAVLGYDAAPLRALAVRFTAPVFPGDRVRFELWRESEGHTLRLRARVDARSLVVLDNGVVEIGSPDHG
jgi:acyl dehydratase